MSALTLVTHPDCLAHRISHHPESPERLGALLAALDAAPFAGDIRRVEAPLASREQLELVHSQAHVERLFALAPATGTVPIDPDTALMPATLNAALRAAGAVIAAVDQTLADRRPAFCAVRPPGHHAERERAMGFCYFNNLAVGVAHALRQPGIGSVAIVDFDVHHGNGTDDIFAHHPRVALFSSFQHPFYPGTRVSTPYGLPLPAFSDGPFALALMEESWLEPLQRLRPDMLFFSAGFDAHRDDPLAGLEWVEADYRRLTEWVVGATLESTRGRVVSVLEGGYDLRALPRSALAHLEGLIAGTGPKAG